MDSFLNKKFWNEKNDPRIHKTSILVFSERELKALCTSAESCKKDEKNLYYSSCYEVSFKHKCFTLVGPVMGAPAAVLLLEKLFEPKLCVKCW